MSSSWTGRPRLEVVGPYIRPLPQTRVEDRVAALGAVVVLGWCAFDWLLRRLR